VETYPGIPVGGGGTRNHRANSPATCFGAAANGFTSGDRWTASLEADGQNSASYELQRGRHQGKWWMWPIIGREWKGELGALAFLNRQGRGPEDGHGFDGALSATSCSTDPAEAPTFVAKKLLGRRLAIADRPSTAPTNFTSSRNHRRMLAISRSPHDSQGHPTTPLW